MTDAASSDINSQQPNDTRTSVAAPAVKEAVGRSVDGHRVLLVDDQPMIGEAVRRLLVDQADMTFAFCKDASKAVTTAEEFQPTVILQDLVMPDIDGLDLVGKLVQMITSSNFLIRLSLLLESVSIQKPIKDSLSVMQPLVHLNDRSQT